MRTRPHHHPCAMCGAKVECCGDIEQNYDGFPEWICREYHVLSNRAFGGADFFLCEGCQWKADDEAEREMKESA